MTTDTLLHILQQSEYDLDYFANWYKRHHQEDIDLQPEKWTPKLKLIKLLYASLFFLPVISRLVVALSLISPLEKLVKFSLESLAQIKLIFYKWQGLKIVAIAGSYGKTSTKQILYHCLKQELPALMTPKSVNTTLGIAGVILSKLQRHHKLFIVELGEFAPEDMKRLGSYVKPDWGILTPIGRQHLERFGSLEKIVKNFIHFIRYFKAQKSWLVVSDENRKFFPKADLVWYGSSSVAQFRVTHAQVSRAGTEYQVSLPSGNTHQVFSPLYGEHQATNSLPAFGIAHQLGISEQVVIKQLTTMPHIKHRHQPTFAAHDVLILDNGYNSNPDSVKKSLALLNQLHPTHRFIITPGFVELGSDSKKIHFKFGQLLADQVDFVGLVQAPDSLDIQAGFFKAGGRKSHLVIANSQEAVMAQLQDKVIPGSIILFENGVNEIYR